MLRNSDPAPHMKLLNAPFFPAGLWPLIISRKSCDETTFLPSAPGTSNPRGLPPTATMAASGLACRTVSGVTFVLRCTVTWGCCFTCVRR